jgi:hypothetical protein
MTSLGSEKAESMPRVQFRDTVATSETARGINRGIVLTLIRKRQPILRARLAPVSGLQGSTVSLIIEQLIREKWVISGSRGRLPRGAQAEISGPVVQGSRQAKIMAAPRPVRHAGREVAGKSM